MVPDIDVIIVRFSESMTIYQSARVMMVFSVGGASLDKWGDARM